MENVVERISSVNEGVWYYDVPPRFTAILGRKFGGATTKFAGGVGFSQYVRIIDIFLRFSFAHIDSFGCFHNEIRLVFLCSARPVNIKLVGNRANPFKNFVIGFEDE